MMSKQTWYEILEVDEKASTQEIRSSYRQLMRRYHPDMIGDQEISRVQLINEAYDVVGDTPRRSDYDRQLRFQRIQKFTTRSPAYKQGSPPTPRAEQWSKDAPRNNQGNCVYSPPSYHHTYKQSRHPQHIFYLPWNYREPDVHLTVKEFLLGATNFSRWSGLSWITLMVILALQTCSAVMGSTSTSASTNAAFLGLVWVCVIAYGIWAAISRILEGGESYSYFALMTLYGLGGFAVFMTFGFDIFAIYNAPFILYIMAVESRRHHAKNRQCQQKNNERK